MLSPGSTRAPAIDALEWKRRPASGAFRFTGSGADQAMLM